jgi:ribosomal protein S17
VEAAADAADDFCIGDEVEVYNGSFFSKKSMIAAFGSVGTCSIFYSDGGYRAGVEEKFIRKTGSPATDDLIEGESVEARYDGGSEFYPGKIFVQWGDGVYWVHYDGEIGESEAAGRKESKVLRRLIKKTGGAPAAAPTAAPGANDLAVGDAVEARYKGREKFYPGKIVRDRGDGTYDVDYDDGKKETRVDKKLIRSKDGGASSSGDNGVLKEGDAVEARYKGREQFYLGKIVRVRGDGTYDIEYDEDGKMEARVKRELIKKTGGAPAAAPAAAAPETDDAAATESTAS